MQDTLVNLSIRKQSKYSRVVWNVPGKSRHQNFKFKWRKNGKILRFEFLVFPMFTDKEQMPKESWLCNSNLCNMKVLVFNHVISPAYFKRNYYSIFLNDWGRMAYHNPPGQNPPGHNPPVKIPPNKLHCGSGWNFTKTCLRQFYFSFF